MADSIKNEIEQMVLKRRWEAEEARRHMEAKEMFKKKAIKVMLPCNVCGNFSEFFVAEPYKVCGECLSQGRTKEDMKDRQLMEKFLAWKKRKNHGEDV